MNTTMTIGDFSRATRLSAKTLRFYHQVGLLEPAAVDANNGYRFYSVDQIADAQVVREFRSLNMSVELIREILAAPDLQGRNELIAEHLNRMEDQLEQTRSAVASLRSLLTSTAASISISHRTFPATSALVIRTVIDLDDLGRWYTQTSNELQRLAELAGLEPTGPRGGIWDNELFLNERGTAALYIPVRSTSGVPASGLAAARGVAIAEELPETLMAAATHRGPDETISQVYAALGEYVARRGLGADGPIREHYLQEPGTDGNAVTEIGWPIVLTR